MTKTLSLTVSLAVALVGFAAVSAPAQAATRLMSSSLDAFEFRCERHGGTFGVDGASASCQTPTVPVACDFFDANQAVCAWPGIQNQVAVIRVIGTLPAGYVASLANSDDAEVLTGNGGGNGGGGLQGPDDLQADPGNNPKPNLDGPKDFQIAPDNDPKPNFDGPKDFQMAP